MEPCLKRKLKLQLKDHKINFTYREFPSMNPPKLNTQSKKQEYQEAFVHWLHNMVLSVWVLWCCLLKAECCLKPFPQWPMTASFSVLPQYVFHDAREDQCIHLERLSSIWLLKCTEKNLFLGKILLHLAHLKSLTPESSLTGPNGRASCKNVFTFIWMLSSMTSLMSKYTSWRDFFVFTLGMTLVSVTGHSVESKMVGALYNHCHIPYI